jgi:hypothetical protein
MTQVFSLLGFVAKLKTIELEMDVLGPALVARACEMVAGEAQRVIGTYDYGWPSLAASTLAKKSADTPLLETGELRASIEWQSNGLRGEVGSNNDKAVWHESGTSRIPPAQARPYRRSERKLPRGNSLNCLHKRADDSAFKVALGTLIALKASRRTFIYTSLPTFRTIAALTHGLEIIYIAIRLDGVILRSNPIMKPITAYGEFPDPRLNYRPRCYVVECSRVLIQFFVTLLACPTIDFLFLP